MKEILQTISDVKRWRYTLMFLLLSCCILPLAAQELTVKSFEQTNDAIARSRNVLGTDGNVCAAVIVRIPVSNATFDGSFIIGKPEYKNGEYVLDLQTGAAQMRVSVPGYNTIDVKFREYLDGSALQSKTTYLLTINVPKIQKTQTLNIKVTPRDAIVQIDGGIVEETKTELTVGTHRYNVAARGYYPQEGTIEVMENAPAKLLVELEKIVPDTIMPSNPESVPYFPKNNFYISAGMQVGSLTGVSLTPGGYIGNVNLEAYVNFGLTKSETIFWEAPSGSSAEPYAAIYTPYCFGAKLGYGIVVGSRLRFTPQVGVGAICLSGDTEQAYRGYATTMGIGCKAEFALIRRFLSIGLSPEYDMALSKSSTYQQLADVSNKIKSWASGFNCRFNLTVSF